MKKPVGYKVMGFAMSPAHSPVRRSGIGKAMPNPVSRNPAIKLGLGEVRVESKSTRASRMLDEARTKVEFEARLKSSPRDFVEFDRPMTPGEVHDSLNALMASLTKK
jgi:hypothetical protein